MQTFLPFPSLVDSAACLDRSRLGKQRVENMQLMSALLVPGAGWSNHPAARMWAGHEGVLLAYQRRICEEWTSRGYRDTCWVKTLAIFGPPENVSRHVWDPPPWFGNPAFHLAHRSNLVRKDAGHYLPLFGPTPRDLEYVWPGSTR